MNLRFRIGMCLLLSSSFLAAQSQTTTTTTTTTTKRAAARRKAASKAAEQPAEVQSQINTLRDNLAAQQQQVQQLRDQLAQRDQAIQQSQQQLQQLQNAASDAQAKADAAQNTAAQANQTANQLQGQVTDLKTNVTNTALTIQDDQKKFNDAINAPDTIHYRGITLSPNGSFIEAATIWRERGEGGDINTQFAGIPYNNSTAGNLTEFNGTGRQSRLALMAEGKLSSVTMRGYYEMDWLGAGVTSNDNQSNSYVLRQRQLWAQARWGSLTMTAGQQWSLVTETRTGLDNLTEVLPMVIDPQYHVGFSWERQYGLRLVKNFNNKLWMGVSAEGAQNLNVGGTNLPSFVYQAAGNTGGLYNNGGNTAQQNYSFNLAPDMVAKIAIEPGWGHYELFGIASFFRDRVFPNGPASATGAYNDTKVVGAVGGNLRVPTFAKHLDVGLHGLWGDGESRYGSTQLADTTAHPNGTLAPLHDFSILGGLELHATPKLDIYGYYGIDYDYRAYYIGAGGKEVGYGAPTARTAVGCNTEIAVAGGTGAANTAASPANCTLDNRSVQEVSFGYWWDPYRGAKGRFRQSIQYSYFVRDTWYGTGGSPSANDPMVWTSIRYYVP